MSILIETINFFMFQLSPQMPPPNVFMYVKLAKPAKLIAWLDVKDNVLSFNLS